MKTLTLYSAFDSEKVAKIKRNQCETNKIYRLRSFSQNEGIYKFKSWSFILIFSSTVIRHSC